MIRKSQKVFRAGDISRKMTLWCAFRNRLIIFIYNKRKRKSRSIWKIIWGTSFKIVNEGIKYLSCRNRMMLRMIRNNNLIRQIRINIIKWSKTNIKVPNKFMIHCIPIRNLKSLLMVIIKNNKIKIKNNKQTIKTITRIKKWK